MHRLLAARVCGHGRAGRHSRRECVFPAAEVARRTVSLGCPGRRRSLMGSACCSLLTGAFAGLILSPKLSPIPGLSPGSLTMTTRAFLRRCGLFLGLFAL